MKRTLPAVVLIAALSLSAAADTYSWTNPAGGYWWQPTNWSGPNFPWAPGMGFSDAAQFSISGVYTVNVGPPPVLTGLNVFNAGTTLIGRIDLSIDTQVTNNGLISGRLLFYTN